MDSSNGTLGSAHQEGALQAQSSTSVVSAAALVSNRTSSGCGDDRYQHDVVVNIPSTTSSGLGSSRRSKVTNEIEAICLEEIEKEPRLKLILADWESKYKESKSRIDRKESLSLNVKNEIYHQIGFFSVFQGVVLTTVSQASALTCHNWWGPFALSLLCSITTVFGVCHKFYNFFDWKRAAGKEIQNSKVLKKQIHLLKKYGKRFDFSEHAPDIDHQKEKEKKKRKSRWEFVVIRYFILGLLVILSMCGFSAIILISCVRSESSSGVHTRLTKLGPGDTYKLVRGSSDTYLQHWVVMGDAPVVCFTSDELIDNEKITIVCYGAAYKKDLVPRHSPPRPLNMLNGQRSQSVGGGSTATTLTPNVGKPPSGFKRFFSSFIRRSPESAATASPALRSVNSAPILHPDVTPL